MECMCVIDIFIVMCFNNDLIVFNLEKCLLEL